MCVLQPAEQAAGETGETTTGGSVPDGQKPTTEDTSADKSAESPKSPKSPASPGSLAPASKRRLFGPADNTAEAKAKAKAAAVEPKAKAKVKAKAKAKGGLPKNGVKLYYYPARGRGEQIRLALAATGISFEDVSFDMSDADAKTEFIAKCREQGGNTTTNIPMLEVKGKFFTQSLAILHYVCDAGGLNTETARQNYQVENTIQAVEDLRTQSYKPLAMFGGGAKEKEVFLELLPKHLGNLERILGDRKHFAAGKLTAADISVYDLLDTMIETQVPGILADKFPKLAAFREKMSKIPGIAKYHESEQHKKLFAFPPL